MSNITAAILISVLVVLVFSTGGNAYLFAKNATLAQEIREKTQALQGCTARIDNNLEDNQRDEIIEKLPDLSVVPNSDWLFEPPSGGVN